ncbi:hypothetical protein OEA41_010594 [Lepraria neglecta]|uniref:GroES-like protein n=1 Tax=Lepraria neglecta TaxID=209136 RepID=A0AAD9Z040_9LECA|nr:hypothetical protein OEA41_010594 [Lepraria neglecta]
MGPSAQDIDFTVYRGSKDGTIIQSTTHEDALQADQTSIIAQLIKCSGHEGASIVQEVGPDVNTLKKGENLGFGYLHSSCGHCPQCLTGKETFCPQHVMYGMGDFHVGSFASHAVWRESYLLKIPENIANEYAAPLQCGGATVFNALEMYDTHPTDRVGIIGVGGLGHLAIQFAAKMGCEVVVFSGTDSKKEEAMKLSAQEFYAMKGVKNLSNTCKPINRLLVTTSQQPDWSLYLPILAPEATVFPLSVSEGNLESPYMLLLLNGIRFQGSVVAPWEIHERMLRFASVHDIKPIIEKFPLNKMGIEQAFEHLDKGEMRYRGVLVA